uniref:Uncharacterized protein n=1 Tax=Rhizophora mucronata TaxID=61149 RepID=A0A2P2PZQ7_RHIMU
MGFGSRDRWHFILKEIENMNKPDEETLKYPYVLVLLSPSCLLRSFYHSQHNHM